MRDRFGLKRLIVVAGLALLFCHHSSFATVQVMDFKFSGIDLDGNGTQANATVRLVFDSITDTDPSPNIGMYTATVTLFSGGSSGQALFPVTVTVENNVPGDGFAMTDASFPPPFVDVDGQLVNAVNFNLASSTADMFSSDALPVNANFASKADSVVLFLTHGDSSVGLPLDPPKVLITTVPEPSPYALLVTGILSLVAVRRAHRR